MAALRQNLWANKTELPPYCQALIWHKPFVVPPHYLLPFISFRLRMPSPIQLDIQLLSLRNASPAGIISKINFGKLFNKKAIRYLIVIFIQITVICSAAFGTHIVLRLNELKSTHRFGTGSKNRSSFCSKTYQKWPIFNTSRQTPKLVL